MLKIVLLILFSFLLARGAEEIPTVGNEIVEKKGDSMSMLEIAGVLRELGIEVPEETVTSMEEAWKDYPEEIAESLDEGAMLLSVLGMGNYNYETWEWTPGSEQVYCFDMEAFDIGNMYGNLFRGIEAISGGELIFSDVNEECDFEKLSGTREVIFKLNAKEYQYDAKQESDWYDLYILDCLNDIIKEQGLKKQLYFMNDCGQGCIVFYADEEWAADFMSKTGYTLYQSARAFGMW